MRYFQVGGTLSPDIPSYIKRRADEQLLEAIQAGKLCLVLAPRQTGKSSLMVHSIQSLQQLAYRCGYVDLQGFGSVKTSEGWFGAMVYKLGRTLQLKGSALDWWNAHASLTPTLRFMTFLEDVVLAESSEQVVLFFDEVDSVLPLSFSDDFFTTIRSLYNEKAQNPVLQRLHVVLSGMASATDLIQNKSRTSFNIATEIQLSDFQADQLQSFQEVLGRHCGPVMERILYWTSGQPYMVQRFAEKLYRLDEPERTIMALDQAVEKAYLQVQLERDVHLKSIRDFLLDSKEPVRKILGLYKKVHAGEDVAFAENSRIHSRLLLSGIVALQNDQLIPRNRIYKKVFNQQWIDDNLPRDKAKTVAWSASILLVAVLSWFGIVKPFFFPNYIKYQQFSWVEHDIEYVQSAVLDIPQALPSKDIRSMEVNGIRYPLPDKRGMKENLPFTLSLPELRQGENVFTIHYSEGLWQDHYEKKLLVVYWPENQWVVPDIRLAPVSGDCFSMGCGDWAGECEEDEKPVHTVCLSGYEIGMYEVTQAQWKALMGFNPSYFHECGGNCPVEQVSWQDVQEFIRRLNKKSGKNYRLPTEAEWEFAARSGGKREKFAGSNQVDEVAWYEKNSKDATKPVGKKKANGLGLYDMSGNVWEWVHDWYDGAYYTNSPQQNPKGPESGSLRVLRGGSWFSPARYCRAAYRFRYVPDSRSIILGFRLVLPGQQETSPGK